MSKLRGTDPKTVKPKKAKILIFGAAGVGKTWGAMDFPSVYYMDIEQGATRDHYTDKLRASNGAYFSSNDYEEVLAEVHALATEKHRYKTLTIDSFTKLYNTERAKAEERKGADGKKLGNKFSVDKKEANKPTRQLLYWLDKIDMNVIVVCHEMDRWENEQCVGKKFDGYEKLDYEFDLAMHIQKRGTRRIAVVTKSRLINFEDGLSFDWSYDEFAKRYGREALESEVELLPMATEQQCSKLRQLVELLNIQSDATDRWLSKAGVSAFEEMRTEDVQKCIDKLQKQAQAITAA